MSQVVLFSFLFPLLALAQQGTNGGNDNPQSPSDAGAEGTQTGAFSLSKGAIAAIAVVASLVIILGSKHESCMSTKIALC